MLTNNKTNFAVILGYAINSKTIFGYTKASQVTHVLEIIKYYRIHHIFQIVKL